MITIPNKKVWFYLILFYFLFGIVTHLSSIFWMIQYEEPISFYKIIDIGFFYYTPVILWALFSLLILNWYPRFPLKGEKWQYNLLLHLTISLLFAPIARVLAISLDYSIKILIGMEFRPLLEILADAKFIFIASAPRAFLFYWVVIAGVLLWEYFQKKEKPIQSVSSNGKKYKQHLFIPLKSGKKQLDVKDIFWISASKNYVEIYTDADCFKLRTSLRKLSSELDEEQFFQVHRSKIINKANIESLAHWRRGEYLITLKNNRLVTSSRSYINNVKKILEN